MASMASFLQTYGRAKDSVKVGKALGELLNLSDAEVMLRLLSQPSTEPASELPQMSPIQPGELLREQAVAEAQAREQGAQRTLANIPNSPLAAGVALVSTPAYNKLTEEVPGANPDAPNALAAADNLALGGLLDPAMARGLLRAGEMPEMRRPASERRAPGVPVGDLLMTGRQPRRSTVEEEGPVFFSQARSVVEDPKTQGTQTGEAWGKFLTDPKRGVKAEEMKWTGLGDFLKSKAGERVTREQILEHLAANEIGIQEVTKGAPHEVVWEPDSEFPGDVIHGRAPDAERSRYVVFRERPGTPHAGKWSLHDSADAKVKGLFFDTPEAAQRAATYALGLERSGQPKFAQYTLPGAENYREVLLTLPPNPPPAKAPEIEIRPAVSPIDGSRMYEAWVGDKMVHRGRTPAEARTVAESNLAETAWGRSTAAGDFRSGHWDEPNVLAHLRLSDRTDADGKRVLLVEELQSDWGQKGRREGFKDPKAQEKARIAYSELDDAMRAKYGHKAWADYSRITVDPVDPRYAEQLERMGYDPEVITPEFESDLAKYRNLEAEAYKQHNIQTIPEAPFVTDTAKWTTLGLKRVLKMAADEGYDRIGIVRGEEQAARYDLSKHADKVDWIPGDRTVRVYKDGSQILGKTLQSDAELADVIGKEAADKLLKQPMNDAEGYRRAPYQSLQGLDLKVGGEGMRGYYDKIVPEALNKLAKEHGVKVQIEGGKVKAKAVEEVADWRKATDDQLREFVGRLEPDLSEEELGAMKRRDMEEVIMADHDPTGAGHPRDWPDYIDRWGVDTRAWGVPLIDHNEITQELNRHIKARPEGDVPIHILDVPEAMRKDIKRKGFPLYSENTLGGLLTSQNA